MVFESIPVSSISTRLETVLSQFVCLNLLAHLPLDFQESFHKINFMSTFLSWQGAPEIEDQIETTKLHFRGKGLSTVENVEKKFWD